MEKLKDRIDYTFSKNSLRNALRKYYIHPEKYQLEADDAIGWSLLLFKQLKMPDAEIYIDTLARGVAEALDTGGILSDALFMDVMIDAISEVTVHEMLHVRGVYDEDSVDFMVDRLFDATQMQWSKIACPRDHTLVSWETCMSCGDFDKHPTCPLQKIRQAVNRRVYQPKLYHVSELWKPRYSFYERWNDTKFDWADYYAMMWGNAMGDYIEGTYPEGIGQFTFKVHAKDIAEFLGVPVDEELDDFFVTGHADLVDIDGRLVCELKTQFNLKYVVNAPNPIHKWQLQCYWTLGLIQFPEEFAKVKEIRLVYLGRQWRKGTAIPPYLEHIVPMNTIDLLTPARMMRRCEITGVPPALRCPDWLCKRCGHKGLCRSDAVRPDDE